MLQSSNDPAHGSASGRISSQGEPMNAYWLSG
jgi:hypothetical protein